MHDVLPVVVLDFALCYMYFLPDTGKLGGILQGIVTSRDVDFLGDEALSRPLSEVRGGGGGWGGRKLG